MGEQPYRCILCNDDMVRFANAGAYVHHMNASHQFHRGYDTSLPAPTARKGHTLPKIGKKKKKKEPVFESQAKALESARAKSVTRVHILIRNLITSISVWWQIVAVLESC